MLDALTPMPRPSTAAESSSYYPVTVQGITSGATALGLGDYHSCAIVSGGLKCRGISYFDGKADSSFAQVYPASHPGSLRWLPTSATSASGPQDMRTASAGTVPVSLAMARPLITTPSNMSGRIDPYPAARGAR